MRNTRVIVTHYGGPDSLQVIDEECPEPKNGEVRVRGLAAGVCQPDLMMREGFHPETPPLPFTLGWDLVGLVDRLGDGVAEVDSGQLVAALPITGAYSEFVCLPQRELVPVPFGLDAAEAVSLVLNYVTAYQMLHRSAKVKAGQRVLIHGATGGVGSALMQLGRLAGLEMYGTCSSQHMPVISALGGIPVDYKQVDFVKEIQRLTGSGVDVVFDRWPQYLAFPRGPVSRRDGSGLWTLCRATWRAIGVWSLRPQESLPTARHFRFVHCRRLRSPGPEARRRL